MRKYSSVKTQKQYDASVIKQQRYPTPDLSKLQFTFFQSAITAFIEDLRRCIRTYLPDFPVYIFNTGDEVMTLEWQETKNVEIYQQIPRMVIDVDALSVVSDQLTSPYQRGEFTIHEDGKDTGYSAYVRRIPISFPMICTVTVSNIIEQLKWQEVILLLLYRNNIFHFQHYKKDNRGVYRLPDDQSVERNIELGFDDSRRNRTIKFTVNIDLQYPAFDYFNSSSLFNIENVILHPTQNIYPDPSIQDEDGGKINTPGENGVSTDYGSGESGNDGDYKPGNPNTNYVVDVDEIPGSGSLVPETGDQFPDANGEIHYDEQAAIDELGLHRHPQDAMLKVRETLNSQEPLPPRTLYKDSDIPKFKKW